MHILLGMVLPQIPVLELSRAWEEPRKTPSHPWTVPRPCWPRGHLHPGSLEFPRASLLPMCWGAASWPTLGGALAAGAGSPGLGIASDGRGRTWKPGPSAFTTGTAFVSSASCPGHSGLVAMAGTWAAKGVFSSQREVLLERPCWLDGGCEQVRRGYLYGQLCCVGGCGRSGWWAGLELVMGCCLAQVQSRLQAPETPGEEDRVVLFRDWFSSGGGGGW